MSHRVVIFDFDGVIADTMDLHYAINHALFPTLTTAQYRTWFYGNIYNALLRETEENTPVSEEKITAFFAQQQQHLAEITVFPPIAQHVVSLYRAGYTLYIVSSNQATAITAVLDRYAMTQYFRDIHGMESGRTKVQKFNKIRAQHPDARHLFITDTLGDLHEATEAGLPALAVLWGLHHRSELHHGRKLNYIAKPQHLFSMISDTFRLHF